MASSAGLAINIPLAMVNPRLFPMIEPGGVVNGATFSAGPVAPASIVSIFGVDLSSFVYAATSVPLDQYPPQLDPIYTLRAGYFYVSPQQWNIQLSSLDPGTYQVAIGSSALVSFEVAPTAPYIFVWNGNRAAALNSDYTLNQAGNPAAAGSALMVYLTGQGAVDPPVPDRFAAPNEPLSNTVANTTAIIDGLPSAVQFSGLAPGYVGVGQVNVIVPSNLAPGEHTLIITIGDVQSNTVAISTK